MKNLERKLQIINKYSGRLPSLVLFKTTNYVSGKSKVTLSYSGSKIDKKTAIEIINNLCVMIFTPQKAEGLGQFINKKDVFTIVAKLIQNKSISFKEAKKTCLLFCSDCVFTFNIEQYTTKGE
jgi:hypothetical protein